MKVKRIGFMLLLTAAGVSAQTAPTPTSLPKATVVQTAEIKAAVQRNGTGAFSDSVLRLLPIEASYNVGVSVVRRSQVHGRTPPDAIVHDAITEVYQITEGKGVLVTGGVVESATPLPADDPDVRQQIGPSSVGKVIRGGTRQNVGPGDIVVIPPHTAHGFVEITTKRIIYTLIRIDPQRLLEPRGEAR
ncbi:MAG: hypothetical protein ACR2IH_07555 [Pyrinomonadaceae bacterium]